MIWGLIFGAVPIFLVFIELPINNLVIYYHVRRTVGKFVASPVPTISEESKNKTIIVSQDLEELQKDRIKEVAMQGFLYVVFFYVSYLPPTIVKVMDTFLGLDAEGEVGIYWLLVLQHALMPLQGWFNLL